MRFRTIYTFLIFIGLACVVLDPARFIPDFAGYLPSIWRRVAWVFAIILFSQSIGILDRLLILRRYSRSRLGLSDHSYHVANITLPTFFVLVFAVSLIMLVCALDFPELSKWLSMSKEMAMRIFGFSWIGGALIGLISTRTIRQLGLYHVNAGPAGKFGRLD